MNSGDQSHLDTISFKNSATTPKAVTFVRPNAKDYLRSHLQTKRSSNNSKVNSPGMKKEASILFNKNDKKDKERHTRVLMNSERNMKPNNL